MLTYVSVSTPALAHVLRFYSSWSFSRKLLRSERPTRPHAAHLVFHCLHLSKDPNWSSCVHPETHLATRDWRHLCRSPPCSPCFLHIKNLLVVLLDLFFIPVRPEDSQKTRPTAPSLSTVPVQVSDHFLHLHVFKVETGNLESTIQQHLSFCLLEAAVHIANIQTLVKNQRWLSFCRAFNSKGGLLKHVMSELTLFLVCSRFAVSLTAHASPAHSWSGFLRARSKVGPFERSSYRCGQPMFWSLAHVEK